MKTAMVLAGDVSVQEPSAVAHSPAAGSMQGDPTIARRR
jgi:hypothetical protein